MSNRHDDIKTAASKLTDAMSGLLRAIDALGDEGAAAGDIPDAIARGARAGWPLASTPLANSAANRDSLARGAVEDPGTHAPGAQWTVMPWPPFPRQDPCRGERQRRRPKAAARFAPCGLARSVSTSGDRSSRPAAVSCNRRP